MFNLRLCNAAIIRYSQLKFGHMYLCGMDYKYFSPHCCKCNSFGCIAAIRWGNACHGPHSDSLYSGSEHSQFNSPRPIKRETGFPNQRRALIGSNHLWRVNDSPYYREYSHRLGGDGGTPWGPGAASAESCTHPAKRDRCFPPPIAVRQRLPNVGIERPASMWRFRRSMATTWRQQNLSVPYPVGSHRTCFRCCGFVTSPGTSATRHWSPATFKHASPWVLLCS